MEAGECPFFMLWYIHVVDPCSCVAPAITIKQLLSPDIIKAGQYVEGGVNPKDSGPACGGGGGTWWEVQGHGQTDEQTLTTLFSHFPKWRP